MQKLELHARYRIPLLEMLGSDLPMDKDTQVVGSRRVCVVFHAFWQRNGGSGWIEAGERERQH